MWSVQDKDFERRLKLIDTAQSRSNRLDSQDAQAVTLLHREGSSVAKGGGVREEKYSSIQLRKMRS